MSNGAIPERDTPGSRVSRRRMAPQTTIKEFRKMNNIEECYLCGSQDDLTKDHVFPKGIFPKPRPHNLITLNCCRKCQISYMKDEEYFRNMLIASQDVYETKSGMTLWSTKVLKGLTRTPGIRRQTIESLKTVESNTRNGVFLGQQKAFLIDKDRFDKVLTKIVQGLHFLHTGFRSTRDIITVNWDPSEKSLSDLSEYRRYIQFSYDFNDIAGYRGAKTIDTGKSSIWWIHFFKKHICVAFVIEKAH